VAQYAEAAVRIAARVQTTAADSGIALASALRVIEV
jgi:hypothetical protein